MKILIDPNLSVFIKDLTDAQCAELLRCIFEYPNRDCDLGVWRYMKKQIEVDAQKYQDKCNRIAINRQKKSMLKSTLMSAVNESSNKNKNKINEIKCSESSNASEPCGKPVENVSGNPTDFFIDENFAFLDILNTSPTFNRFLSLFPGSVISRAEDTIKLKRAGQWLNISQIMEWIEQEDVFRQQKQGTKPCN